MVGMVIVGAGEAGTRAALALRENGWTGGITLIGEEASLPYERPPLSKAVLTATDTPMIAAHDRLTQAGIDFRPDCRVVQIDRVGRNVVCRDGTAIPYTRLLLATGAHARRLTIQGGEHALTLRNFADALALRARLARGAHVVVIGGGFIGLEVAASAVARGCRVTLLEAGPRILMRGVPAEIAARVTELHRSRGVDLRVGVTLQALSTSGTRFLAVADGSEIVCDTIVAGVGAVPEIALAAKSGLAIDNGVTADETLRTSDPAISAAGDCCCAFLPLYQRHLRLEAWRNAQAQGALAARNMLGAGAPNDDVPWFWSDQYDQTLQVAGLPSAGVVTIRRDVADGALLFFHLAEDGTLVAASGIGTLALSKDIRVAEMLISRRARPDPAALGAPAVRLRSLLAA